MSLRDQEQRILRQIELNRAQRSYEDDLKAKIKEQAEEIERLRAANDAYLKAMRDSVAAAHSYMDEIERLRSLLRQISDSAHPTISWRATIRKALGDE